MSHKYLYFNCISVVFTNKNRNAYSYTGIHNYRKFVKTSKETIMTTSCVLIIQIKLFKINKLTSIQIVYRRLAGLIPLHHQVHSN